MLAERGDWTPLKAYGRSKLCNILFTGALARRVRGSGVVAACLHPGVVAFFLAVGISLPAVGLVASFIVAAALVLVIDAVLLVLMRRRQRA